MSIKLDLKRTQLSDYLPYVAYDEKTQEFINKDGLKGYNFGYMFECQPLYFLGEKSLNTMASILKQDYGKGSILQFILYADTNIDKYCNDIKQSDVLNTQLTKKLHNYHSNFLKSSENYQDKTKGNKVKNFRLFVCLKTLKSLERTTILAFKESLAGVGLSPRPVNANKMLSVVRQLLNGAHCNNEQYNDDISLSKQAILSNTHINISHDSHIKVNDEFVGIVTPKSLPESKEERNINTMDMNDVTGSWLGGIDDLNQITSRFVICFNIIMDKVQGELSNRSRLVNLQKAGAKMSNTIGDRITALSYAVKNNSNAHYLKFIPTILLFADSEEELAKSSQRTVDLWEKHGFFMQKENYIKHILFLSSLPFGLYLGKRNTNLSLIDRHFIASSKSIATLLPLQADYNGFGKPVVPFIGRKGQVQGLDIYDPSSNNHNMLCSAETGGGKSFFFNWFLTHYYAAGAKIRLIDIGGSYEKICNLLGGEYIDIAKTTPNFNPFKLSQDLVQQYDEKHDDEYDERDKRHDIESIARVIASMICSNSSNTDLTTEEIGLITHAVKETVARDIVVNGIDFVQKYLTNLDSYSSSSQIPRTLTARAKELAFNLCEFSSKGDYGKYFNGDSDNTWLDNSFVVLELEALSKKEALMKVVSLQIINMMTMEMYQGDRSIKKLLVLEECAYLLNSSKFMEKVAEDGYRRARKYNGSFIAIFQSPKDPPSFGKVGSVMAGNSAYKIYLESDQNEEAVKEGIINLDNFSTKLLTSIKSNRPHYSEVFAITPGGVGVMRLMVGPYGYAVATSDANERNEIQQYQKNGMSVADALEAFAAKRGLAI